jgi:hypothetical protein
MLCENLTIAEFWLLSEDWWTNPGLLAARSSMTMCTGSGSVTGESSIW